MPTGYRMSFPSRVNICFLAMSVSTVGGGALQGQALPQLLTATETLRIDGDAHQLSPVNGVLVAPSGQIAILQPQDHQIRFFTREGRALGTFGRQGAGPGEFRSLLSVAGWLGDTLWVNDSRLRRTTFIGPERRLQRTLGWPRGVLLAGDVNGTQPRSLVVPWGFVSPDAIIAPLSPPAPVVVGDGNLRSVSSGIFRMDTEGRVLALLVERGSGESTDCHKRWREGEASGTIAVPFCAEELYHVSPDGRWTVIVRPLAPTATTVGVRLVVVDARGDTVIARRLEAPSERPTTQQRDSAARLLRVLANGGGGRPMSEAGVRAIATIELPTRLPMVEGVLVGRDGTVWLRRPATGPTRTWWIVSADGGAVYRTTLPSTTTLRVVSKETVWGVDTDAEDVESIVRYRVAAPR